MSALLEVQDLEKRFSIVGSRNVVQAVNGVDFIINSGETLALVGESGSGKTTIGRAVVGLIEATAGSIRFDGKQMGRGRNIRSNDIRGRSNWCSRSRRSRSIRVSVSARPWPNPCAIRDYRERTARRACAMWPRGLVWGARARPIPSRVERRAAAACRNWTRHRHQAAADRTG